MASGAGSQAYVKMIPTERRAVGALALVLAFRMFGLFVLLPVLALYASELPGGTPVLAGLAVGAFGVTQAVLQIPAGLLSDRIGRKAVIVLGLIVFAAGSLVAAQAESIAGVLTGRVLQGAGAISAATTALVADLTRGEVRTRAMAIVGISIGATFMLALAVGPALGESIGVVGLFYLGAGLAVLAGVVLLAAGQLGLLFAPSATAIVAALAVFFAGFNFLEARLPAGVSRIAGPRSRGTALGIFATGQFLGAFTGGLAGGALIGAGGPGAVFGAGVALAAGWSLTVAAAIAAWKPSPDRR